MSKLRQVPRLCGRPRNINDAPGILVKVGLETWRGALNLSSDPARLYEPRRPAHSRDWRTRPPKPRPRCVYIAYLESDIAPGPRRRSDWVARGSSRSCSSKRALAHADGCCRLPFASSTKSGRVPHGCGRLNGGDPIETGAGEDEHPAPGTRLRRADSLGARGVPAPQAIVTVPDSERWWWPIAGVLSRAFASMWTRARLRRRRAAPITTSPT